MKIEMLDDKTIKVLLTGRDMAHLQLNYSDINETDANAKKAIIKLLDEIKEETKIDLCSAKIFVEAFPYADGGCILYVTSITKKVQPPKSQAGFSAPLIFSFESLEPLIIMARGMSNQYGHIILKSSLYAKNSTYYLMIYSYYKLDEKLIRYACEYGAYYGKGAVCAAVIKEHSKEIIPSEALLILSGL